jgi:cytochrome c oxidase subunit 2
MKIVYAVIIIGVFILGGWYFFGNDAEVTDIDTSADETNVSSESTNQENSGNSESTNGTSGTTLKTETSVNGGATVSNKKTFDLSGSNFQFDVKEIRVKKGDAVTINFSAAEGFHDWVVDEFKAATSQVRPGTPTSVTFVADKTGTFAYYCSVGSHRSQGMVGKLIVE